MEPGPILKPPKEIPPKEVNPKEESLPNEENPPKEENLPKKENPPKEEFYDDVYFDTEEEDNNEPADKLVPTNDELLYDPDLDNADERWLTRQITKTMPKDIRTAKDPPVARTDAVLTCPMCFTPVCYSCQRHENYLNQYRAIFVTNCHPDRTQRFRYAPSKSKSRKMTHKKTQKIRDNSMGGEEEQDRTELMETGQGEVYYPVACDVCATQVAMMDEEEVFHFFNVIATQG
ncbi:E2F-associated phospho protein-domain-containing protein [Endogone sp. FLAS-F59071]|nr:E2F-associated phospho protein-domain-containing protein [Endogone sp. FLAS-F59071]|eukprot:RUS22144.1 E2F-associated phospho protein-domain-containing protein [Endogone sp. FLAS-F59071]